MRLHTATGKMGLTKFLKKLHEEVEEVEDEIDLMLYLSLDDPEFFAKNIQATKENLIDECFDIMQVCYTFLRKMYTKDEIEAANTRHLEKLTKKYGPTEE